MPKTDTSTESVERSAKFAENCRGGWQYGADLLRDLAAERDTLAKRVEDTAEKYSKLADKYHEKIDEIIELRQQLAEAKGKENAFRMALRQVFAWASEARPAGYENAILKIEEISESALKSERAPRQNSDDELQRMQAAVDQGKDII
ncbi:hypothetical protein EPIB1_1137 [Tritonibacter mobilis]|uniref:hypothetical protein n=1 Tax=Tritonibacter mobilis TaxID=379347 RepID=UPI000F719F1F|nr:hypothetical protein [Tritonibacter mobilis]VCU58239.1 hypothetical protein EPIB1_1137 [Tritonibacter mobilis]